MSPSRRSTKAPTSERGGILRRCAYQRHPVIPAGHEPANRRLGRSVGWTMMQRILLQRQMRPEFVKRRNAAGIADELATKFSRTRQMDRARFRTRKPGPVVECLV